MCFVCSFVRFFLILCEAVNWWIAHTVRRLPLCIIIWLWCKPIEFDFAFCSKQVASVHFCGGPLHDPRWPPGERRTLHWHVPPKRQRVCIVSDCCRSDALCERRNFLIFFARCFFLPLTKSHPSLASLRRASSTPPFLRPPDVRPPYVQALLSGPPTSASTPWPAPSPAAAQTSKHPHWPHSGPPEWLPPRRSPSPAPSTPAQRSAGETSELKRKLYDIFPDQKQRIDRILNDNPYMRDLNALSGLLLGWTADRRAALKEED